MNMKTDLPVAMIAVIMILFLIGALLAYSANPESYSASASKNGNSINVEMYSSIKSDYTVCAVDFLNEDKRTVWVYYDENYTSVVGHDAEKENLETLESQFSHVGVTYKMIDAAGLENLFRNTVKAFKNAVIFLSGDMPSTVYSYDGDIFRNQVKPWMEAGGLVYWYSDQRFGYYSAVENSKASEWNKYQPKEKSKDEFEIDFFDSKVYGNIRSPISKMIGTTQNIIDTYTVVKDGAVNLGYSTGPESDDHRSSLAFVKFGAVIGGVIICGGTWTQDMSYAKIIASGVCDWNMDTVVQCKTGSFSGTKILRFEDLTFKKIAVYVYYGNITPRYGNLILP